MTVREVVEQVKKDLGEINVPVAQLQSIGFPIARAIEGLDAVIQAWDEEDKQNREKQKAQEKPNPDEPTFTFDVIPEDDALVEAQNNG